MRRLMIVLSTLGVLSTVALAETLQDAGDARRRAGPKPASNPLNGQPATFEETVPMPSSAGCSFSTPPRSAITITSKGDQLCIEEWGRSVSTDSNLHALAAIRKLQSETGESEIFFAEVANQRSLGSCTFGSATAQYVFEVQWQGCVANSGYLTLESAGLQVLAGNPPVFDVKSLKTLDPHQYSLEKLKFVSVLSYAFKS